MELPENPAAWYQLAAIGGWQAVVADTVHPLAHDLLAARCAGETGRTRGWYDLPFAIPVLCAAATAQGMRSLQQAVMVLHAEGLPLRRTVVALVATGDGRPPVAVRAGAAMLTSRTAAVVQVPHDPHVHAHSLAAARLRPRTLQAGARLAGAVLAAAHAAWGGPLPDAPQPAPVTPAPRPTPAIPVRAAVPFATEGSGPLHSTPPQSPLLDEESDMSQLLATVHTAAVAVAVDPHVRLLADAVPNVTPEMPKDVDKPVQSLLNWTAGLGLAAAVLGGLLGWAAVAVGHNSERAALAARGKQAILWSLFGAGGIGVTAALVTTFYNMGK
ncbi:hypothetical protein STENM327S_06136 [Streptomyces tendae]